MNEDYSWKLELEEFYEILKEKENLHQAFRCI
jgi:hypothetical protein